MTDLFAALIFHFLCDKIRLFTTYCPIGLYSIVVVKNKTNELINTCS